MADSLPFTTPDLTEVGDRVWVARHPWYDVNVTVVAGEESLAVVDTHASTASMAALLPGIRALSALPVSVVVATHAHHDHVLGTSAVLEQWPGATWVAHEQAALAVSEQTAAYVDRAARRADDASEDLDDEARARLRLEAESPLVVPTETLSAAWAADLGGRVLEVVHPGRGHTDGDVMVRVGDAGVVVVGDLVEQSGPPAYGPDSWPLDWPASLDLVLQLTLAGEVVVPGHGATVDRGFVEDQRDGVGQVAEQVRALAASGAAKADVAALGTWPYPVESLDHAIARAWDHLPRGSRQLPMA